ncbi:MAG: ABC transporter permease [Chloroflexota bacterium]|nr:MAG: ABC transporter permease [Chloroflexota bacterium]
MEEILRNMARRRMRTGLTVLGIVVGVFALTVMGGLSEYFNVMLDSAERFAGSTVQVGPVDRSFEKRPNESTVRMLGRVEGVQLVMRVLSDVLSDNMSTVQFGPPNMVMAVQPEHSPLILEGVKLRQGRWLQSSDTYKYNAVVGAKIATAKNVSLGDTIEWRKKQFTVVGMLDLTNSIPDQYVVVPFDVARKEMKLPPDTVGGIAVVPRPGADPEEVAARINREMPTLKATSPRQMIDEIRQGLLIFNVIMLSGALLAAIVGGLSVINTMIMSVNERTKEIGIKKAIGASDRDIILEYLAEATVIGFVGGVVGLMLGYGMASLLNAAASSALGGTELWVVTPRLATLVVVFATILGAAAGLYPAWNAARLDPVKALRTE